MKPFSVDQLQIKDFNVLPRLGFFCSTADGKITTNRKFRIQSLSFLKVVDTFKRNLEDFKKLLEISRELGCGIFRLGSSFIPFASHPNFKKEWFTPIEELLRDFARCLTNFGIRITMHPGQYVVLNSPNKEVVEKSLRELEYHFWVLDCLGIGDDGVVVIHGGGVFGDKKESLKRLIKVLSKRDWLRARLAFENDEHHYTVSDLLAIAELGYPLVFDLYHHKLNPSYFDPEQIIKSWNKRRPEFHLSSLPQRPHRLSEHGDWVDPEDFFTLVRLFNHHTYDVIVEAKQKEKAIIKLIQSIKEKRGKHNGLNSSLVD